MSAMRKPSGAQLRAAREQRERQQLDPGAEASRHEASFLANLSRAQSDFEWIVERQAWTVLGHDSLADWWVVRVAPVMSALAMRPTPEIAARVVEQIRAQDAALPRSQRRTQRELAALVGVSQSAPVIRPRSAPERKRSGSDLEGSVTTDSRPGREEGSQAGPETATGALTSPVDGVTPLEDSGGEPQHCEACGEVIDRDEGNAGLRRCRPCDPDGLHLSLDKNDVCDECTPTDSLAGQPQVPDVPEVSPLVAHDQPETSHPSATGEARAEVGEALPGAGAQPADDAHTSAVDEPEGGMAVPPPGDPEATRFLAFANDMQAVRAALLRWNAEEIAALRPEALAALHGLEALVSALAEQVELAAADAA